MQQIHFMPIILYMWFIDERFSSSVSFIFVWFWALIDVSGQNIKALHWEHIFYMQNVRKHIYLWIPCKQHVFGLPFLTSWCPVTWFLPSVFFQSSCMIIPPQYSFLSSIQMQIAVPLSHILCYCFFFVCVCCRCDGEPKTFKTCG